MQIGGSGSIEHLTHASFVCGIAPKTSVNYTELKSDAEWSSLIWQIATWTSCELLGDNAAKKAALVSLAHPKLDGEVDMSLQILVYLLGK